MIKFRYPKLRDTMVGSWCPSLGTTGNLLIDRSVRGNNGIINVGSGDSFVDKWQVSGGKYSLSFDGTNDYAVVNSTLLKNLPQVSVSCWVNMRTLLTTTAQISDLVSDGFESDNSAYFLRFREGAGQLIDWGSYTGGATNTSYGILSFANPLSVNTWAHLCGTFSGSSWVLYINGRAVSTVSNPRGLAANTTVFGFGGARIAGTWSRFFNGRMDAISIFNQPLVPAEVALLARYRGIEHETYRVAVVRSAAVGQAIALGRATETESANSLSVSNPNVITLGRATEVESVRSLTISNPNVVVLGRATEIESANLLTINNPNVIALGRSTEVETANGVTVQAGNTVQLGRAVETESVQSLAVSNPNAVLLGRATETESARSLSVAIAQSISLGRATETEVARGVTITTGSSSPSSYFYQFLAG